MRRISRSQHRLLFRENFLSSCSANFMIFVVMVRPSQVQCAELNDSRRPLSRCLLIDVMASCRRYGRVICSPRSRDAVTSWPQHTSSNAGLRHFPRVGQTLLTATQIPDLCSPRQKAEHYRSMMEKLWRLCGTRRNIVVMALTGAAMVWPEESPRPRGFARNQSCSCASCLLCRWLTSERGQLSTEGNRNVAKATRPIVAAATVSDCA